MCGVSVDKGKGPAGCLCPFSGSMRLPRKEGHSLESSWSNRRHISKTRHPSGTLGLLTFGALGLELGFMGAKLPERPYSGYHPGRGSRDFLPPGCHPAHRVVTRHQSERSLALLPEPEASRGQQPQSYRAHSSWQPWGLCLTPASSAGLGSPRLFHFLSSSRNRTRRSRKQNS